MSKNIRGRRGDSVCVCVRLCSIVTHCHNLFIPYIVCCTQVGCWYIIVGITFTLGGGGGGYTTLTS